MGEAAKKPTAFELQLQNAERYTLYALFTQTLKCGTCKAGPLDTTDPVKFLKFGKVWNLFHLSEFEDLNQDSLTKLLVNLDDVSVSIEADVLRFLIETILAYSSNLNSFIPVITILNKLIKIAKENKIKINNYEEADEPKLTSLEVTNDEFKLLTTILLSAQRCANKFELNNGATVEHGAPLDNPKTIKEYALFIDVINQLTLTDVFAGKKEFESFENTKSFDLNTETIQYLSQLVARRSTSIGLPANKLLGIFNKLEEAKK